jgi:hypothetical protein
VPRAGSCGAEGEGGVPSGIAPRMRAELTMGVESPGSEASWTCERTTPVAIKQTTNTSGVVFMGLLESIYAELIQQGNNRSGWRIRASWKCLGGCVSGASGYEAPR